MSFSLDQCRKFKEWGYPQGGAERYYDTKWPYRMEPITFPPSTTRRGVEYAIPTLEVVIEWLGNQKPNDVARLELQPDGYWWASLRNIEQPIETTKKASGSTAHEALYNLARKVKEEG